jgi:hypothetical protein
MHLRVTYLVSCETEDKYYTKYLVSTFREWPIRSSLYLVGFINQDVSSPVVLLSGPFWAPEEIVMRARHLQLQPAQLITNT